MAVANVAVAALGSATYAVATGPLGANGPRLPAAGATFVVGASIAGLLLKGWPLTATRTAWRRTWLAVSATGIAVAAYAALHWLGLGTDRHRCDASKAVVQQTVDRAPPKTRMSATRTGPGARR
ncbi:hypothetical protein FRZ03_09025 [Streptomyces misionensis]|uniref:Uncharacterized protein n=1 Tax=Streptomyces misionensis TaxID=67331 RepID=A0A5C6JWT3_9ACTN|nr:hypothetical protein [Streptomyces misionensis]TWV53715.1 hypothetical protein FRZ03_09025 [Streptomyces misionensis]